MSETGIKMRKSRLEINVQRLLNQCEKMASENNTDDWRLEKFIESLHEMVQDLQNSNVKPEIDILTEYKRRVAFLQGIIKSQKLTSPMEKVAAVQHLPSTAATSSEPLTKEIQQKTMSKYNTEVRDKLLRSNSEYEDNVRLRKQTTTTDDDMDSLLKYHHSMHEKIAENMMILAQSLKEQTQLANTIINKDTKDVEKSSQLADKNYSQLKKESEKLEEHSRRAWKCWMWFMIAAVVVIFLNMVLFMRFMKKKTS